MSELFSFFTELSDKLEDVIAEVASEKMDAKLEDLAREVIPEVLGRKLDQAFEDMDVAALILERVHAVDLDKVVKDEVHRIVVKLLNEQLAEMIRKQVRAVLLSDAQQREITELIAVQVKSAMTSAEITRKLEELAKEGMSNALQRWTKTLIQSGAAPGDGSIP